MVLTLSMRYSNDSLSIEGGNVRSAGGSGGSVRPPTEAEEAIDVDGQTAPESVRESARVSARGSAKESADLPRPTVRRRRTVRAVVWDDPSPGYSAQDDYVRRFWTAVIGPGAVADLLRLMAAAQNGCEIKRPVFLSELARFGLAAGRGDVIAVRQFVPPIPAEWMNQLPVTIRKAHAKRGGDSLLV